MSAPELAAAVALHCAETNALIVRMDAWQERLARLDRALHRKEPAR